MADFLGKGIPDNITLNTQPDVAEKITPDAKSNVPGLFLSNPPIFKPDDSKEAPESSASNEKYLKREFNGPATLDEPVLETIVNP